MHHSVLQTEVLHTNRAICLRRAGIANLAIVALVLHVCILHNRSKGYFDAIRLCAAFMLRTLCCCLPCLSLRWACNEFA